MKCYYTDPLAAAWMAKHHGMRFWNGKHEIHVLPFIDAENEGKHHIIHPASHPLLEPKMGDIVHNPGSMQPYANICLVEFRDYLKQHGNYRILERNGKPFFWPEKEGA